MNRRRLYFLLAVSLAATSACSGPAGPTGPAGEDGTNGTNGTDGIDGTDGVDRVLDPSLTPIDKMFAALGGREAVLALTGLEIQATGVRFIAGEGVSPDAEPAVANDYATTTSLNLEDDFARVDTARTIRFLFAGAPQTYSEIAQGGLGAVDGIESVFGFPTGAMSADRAAAFRKQLRLMHPILLARAIADDETLVSDGGEAMLGRLLYHVLIVDEVVAPIEVYVDTQTGEIARITTRENDYLHRDVELEALYLNWEPAGGVQAPREAYLVKDGELLIAEDRDAANAAPTFDAALFNFPADITPVADAGLAERGERSHQYHYTLQGFGLPIDGVEPAFTVQDLGTTSTVARLAGFTHNAFVVEQTNGFIVVDAPLYDERADAILAALEARSPGKPITHVIASHFHEDHVAGIRTLLGASNAALVVSERTVDFWREILAAPSTIVPDTLALNPRAVEIIPVDDDTGLVINGADPEPVAVRRVNSVHAVDLLFTHATASDIGFIVDIYSPGNPGNGTFPFATAQFRSFLVDNGLDSPTLEIVGGHGGASSDFAQLEIDIDAVE